MTIDAAEDQMREQGAEEGARETYRHFRCLQEAGFTRDEALALVVANVGRPHSLDLNAAMALIDRLKLET